MPEKGCQEPFPLKPDGLPMATADRIAPTLTRLRSIPSGHVSLGSCYDDRRGLMIRNLTSSACVSAEVRSPTNNPQR